MFSYTPDFLPSSIVLIGAGGTGSRLMPMLSQLVRTCIRKFNPNAWMDKLPIYVIDGDVVEEKNLLRQNFIQKDVGKPKASVLAARYSAAFGIEIYPCIDFLSVQSSINFIGHSESFSFNNSVVILAVDSADARRSILKRMFFGKEGLTYQNTKCFVIDAGNEDSFGQVKFFTMNALMTQKGASSLNFGLKKNFINKFPNQVPKEYKTSVIPFDPYYYDTLGSSSQELSCADLPQTLAINAMMATLICCVVQNFLYLKPMNYDGIRFSMTGAITTEYNSARRWLQRIEDKGYTLSRFGFTNAHMECSSAYVHGDNPKIPFLNLLAESTDMYLKAGLIIAPNGELIPDPKKIEIKPKPTETLLTSDGILSASATGVPPLTPLSQVGTTEISTLEAVPASPVQTTNRPRRTRQTATARVVSVPATPTGGILEADIPF